MTLLQDLRFAVRLLVKSRSFTLVAAFALALGIAANNAVFTFVNAILLRGVPFENPEQIVSLGTRDVRNRNLGVSFLDFQDWRAASRSFSDMSLFGQPPLNVSDEGRAPERYAGAIMSAGTFRLVGEKPILGRVFTDDEDRLGAAPTVVLGYGIWQSRYGGEASVIGRTIKVSDMHATVIGIMPKGMQFPPNTDLWLPLSQATIVRGQSRQLRLYQVIARLADGMTLEQAQSELTAIASRLAQDYPATNKDFLPTVIPYNQRVVGSQLRLLFWTLMGAVAFVLLIACANVANLLLARAADRAKEVSIKVSLGASRWRIARQLLIESVLLAGFAGLIALPLSMIGIRLFDAAVEGQGKPYWMVFSLDGRVFVFLFAVCFITGIVFGLAPALYVSRTNVNEVLKEGGRSGMGGVRARRWTSALLVGEIALTLVLLAGAGFMMRSFLSLYGQDLAIDTSRLLTMQLALPDSKYGPTEVRNAFIRRLDERLGGVGAFESATTTSNLPLRGGFGLQLSVAGRPATNDRPPLVGMLSVGYRYFETLGLPILRGRSFNEADSIPGREAAIVNQRFVEMHFAGEDPLGRQIRLTEEVQNTLRLPLLTVVGVSANLRQRNVQEMDYDPIVYVPNLATPSQGGVSTLIVRTRADAGRVTSLVRDEVRALDSDIPVFNIRTMDESLAQQRFMFRVFGTMFAAFAFIALLLAAIGLYAVTAYSVTQRTQEIGVRMALGARPSDVIWLFLRRASVLVVVGLILGLAGAFGVGTLLQSVLVRTSTYDAVTLVSIAALMSAVAIAACFWPARRATRLDPLAALRYE
jgi:putative ABC transport system permease protein